jgi:hypothetical protein
MARQVSADQATPSPPGLTETPTEPTPVQRAQSRLLQGVTLCSAAVATGAGLGLLAALALQGPATVEPALANLLHAMVAIKAMVFTAAAALVLYRLRGPVGDGSLIGYCGGLAASAAALVWLWGLSGLLLGSALFYGGLIVTYLTATKDPLLADAMTPARSPGG